MGVCQGVTAGLPASLRRPPEIVISVFGGMT